MKQLLTFLVLVCSYVLCTAQATSLTVDNQTPGWLSSKINYGDQQTIENLSISGYLNGTDIRFIRELINERNLHGELNLSKATIVSGGDPYFFTNTIQQTGAKYTENNTIGEYMFANLASLRTLVLPYSTTKISNENVFRGCSNIDSLIVDCPNLSTFQGLKYTSAANMNIKYIYFGEGIEKIDLGSYRSNKFVENGDAVLSLPSTMTEIVEQYSITTPITIYSNILDPTIVKQSAHSSQLPDIFNKGVAYVPPGTSELYKKSFLNKLEIIENVYPEEVLFEEEKKILYCGDTYTISYTIYPINAIHNDLIWSTSDDTVVDVNSDGQVCALSYGVANVSATTINNLSATMALYVYEHVSEISIPSSISLNIGETKVLEYSLYPLGKTFSNVHWESLNPSIADVNQNGEVNGISKGNCRIKATSSDGKLAAYCDVHVTQGVEDIKISQSELSIRVNESSMLSASVLPIYADNKQIIWSSEDASIARISNDGAVVGVSGGETKIIATSAENPEIKAECAVTVIQPVTGISINKTQVELVEDESEQLIATVLPENASNKTVNWTSSDISVAMVSPDGTVYAVKNGQSTIMATTVDGGFVALCKVTVKAKTILADDLLLSQTFANLAVSETIQLTAALSPENVTNKSLRWSSTNSLVATVSESGLVTGMSEGNAQIIVTTTDGSNLSAICNVTVEKQLVMINSISLSPNSLRIEVAESKALTPVITPTDATNQNLTWSSTNSAVATISQDGVVHGVSEGNAIIIATTQDGSNLSATCEVEVYRNQILVTAITLNPNKIDGEEEEKCQILATVLPENADNKGLSWSSSDIAVASVDFDGLVTLKAKGTATITATATDGSNVKAECLVIVSEKSGIEDVLIDKDAHVKVYTLTGALIFEGEYSHSNLLSGTYIVLAKNKAIKQVVK